MKLLFTGGSGFLGNNIIEILKKEYDVATIGISPSDNYCIDITQEVFDLKTHFDIVLHAAGKAHSVPASKSEEEEFFRVNYEGTKLLCKSLEKSGLPKAFIFISTVAVYGCNSGLDIDEDFPLKGETPYALSKIRAENFLSEWCIKHNITLGILRPSLIAGNNAPGNLGAMVRGIKNGKYLSIGGGKTRKSVVMAEDIAHILPKLAKRGGIYNLCDNTHPSFRELERIICLQLNKKLPPSIPYAIAKGLALAGDCLGKKAPINSMKLEKISKSLTFSNEKAKRELQWQPLNVLDNYII